MLRIAKESKTERKENRKCKGKFSTWSKTKHKEKQRIELAISESTKNENSEPALLWYHVRIQAHVQSSSMEEIKQTMGERWENCICIYW